MECSNSMTLLRNSYFICDVLYLHDDEVSHNGRHQGRPYKVVYYYLVCFCIFLARCESLFCDIVCIFLAFASPRV